MCRLFTDASWHISVLLPAENILSGKGKCKHELEQRVEAIAFLYPDVALPSNWPRSWL
jgi:hypothetical protein